MTLWLRNTAVTLSWIHSQHHRPTEGFATQRDNEKNPIKLTSPQGLKELQEDTSFLIYLVTVSWKMPSKVDVTC